MRINKWVGLHFGRFLSQRNQHKFAFEIRFDRSNRIVQQQNMEIGCVSISVTGNIWEKRPKCSKKHFTPNFCYWRFYKIGNILGKRDREKLFPKWWNFVQSGHSGLNDAIPRNSFFLLSVKLVVLGGKWLKLASTLKQCCAQTDRDSLKVSFCFNWKVWVMLLESTIIFLHRIKRNYIILDRKNVGSQQQWAEGIKICWLFLFMTQHQGDQIGRIFTFWLIV
jgi:hypothetical protein